MLRTILRSSTSVTKYSRRSLSNSSNGIWSNNKKKTLFFGGIASFIVYDYAARDLELVGGFSRFVRSIKIAAQISFDYTYSLWGLEDDESVEYNQVRFGFSSN